MPTPMKGFDLPPLSVEDKLIRDYLFHRSKLESEILINFDIQHGTRKNIWTLDRGCWLDGQQHILQHKVHKPNMLKSYFGTKRYTGKIESCERVYIPINDAGEHWYMCVVYMRQQVVYILDPYISRRSRTRPTQVKKVVEVLHDLLGIQYKNAYTNKITKFPIRTLE
ncbi:uncharacterized protein LOC114284879 [Camellia sinensis]|uniref:uncharacterized protein LOC114284879 n=1 Tax=Camellia sinensis TaxID=4442 RepID=UPI001035DAFF|nr:uncharacterized protein LOC114284879 [Camellia sinensis]